MGKRKLFTYLATTEEGSISTAAYKLKDTLRKISQNAQSSKKISQQTITAYGQSSYGVPGNKPVLPAKSEATP